MGLVQKIKRVFKIWVKEVITEIQEEKKHDIKYGLQELALRETCEWIQDNVPVNLIFSDRYALLDESIKNMEDQKGLILEFGVYRGSTINFIAKKINDDAKIFGFDSFEGLNEAWIFNNVGGFSDVGGALPSVPDNVELVKGYFDETLPNFVNEQKDNISLLHIDSDLYSSCKTIFDFLHDRIVVGTVIVFDEFFNYPDWKNGEFKAWGEFLKDNNIEFKYLGYTYQRTKRFKSGNQLAVQVTKRLP
ncbi:class I SAM-dependent methyltransferase [Patiriisocius sp. Uisw_047]|jgi:predicted O-methyltransferase YrrM|uniref:class I SAM-dependent methyltransferase n=1 Tax=Patiriisocius sp. Uisw_047 TaxID=3230969 RepID=UPI0039EB1480